MSNPDYPEGVTERDIDLLCRDHEDVDVFENNSKVAEKIVRAIWADISDRIQIKILTFDENEELTIMHDWANKIDKILDGRFALKKLVSKQRLNDPGKIVFFQAAAPTGWTKKTDSKEQSMSYEKCNKCDGCGEVANTEEQEPWIAWLSLPLRSSAAVLSGIVFAIPCPECKGARHD